MPVNDGGGAAGRCLSDLPDDLLRHILFFAPAREGATTAVLSRRWRWLWRTSGAVNLDFRSFVGGGCSSPEEEREAFLRGADEALAAAGALGGPIKRLTFSIAEDSRRIDLDHNMVKAIVSNPAARHVEVLQIEVETNEQYTLCIGSLPSKALRVLHLTNCCYLTAPAAPGAATAMFPMLVDLRLQSCFVTIDDLQAIFDVAPRLSTLHLESSLLSIRKYIYKREDEDDDDDKLVMGQLVVPAVTTLVLADWMVANCAYGKEPRVQLDVPRLQYFRYKGSVQQTERLSLKPPDVSSSNMIQVDLELTYDYQYYNYSRAQQTPPNNLFWQFVRNFSTTKLLKLKLDDRLTMDDVALVEKASRDELLGGLSFHLLEKLELEAKYKYKPGVETSSLLMLEDLLHHCPMVRDLQVRSANDHEMPWGIMSSTVKEAGMLFDMSVNGFWNRRNNSMVTLGGGQNDVKYEAFGIPAGLTGEHSSFSCKVIFKE